MAKSIPAIVIPRTPRKGQNIWRKLITELKMSEVSAILPKDYLELQR